MESLFWVFVAIILFRIISVKVKMIQKKIDQTPELRKRLIADGM